MLATAPPRLRSKPLVLASTSLGTFLVILLTSGLNIMSPAIRSELGASPGALSWVLSGYTVAFAMFSLTGGLLADRYGAHRVFILGLGVFALSSVVAGTAPSIDLVVVGTFGEGAGAALVLPSALSLIQNVFQDEPERLGGAIGIWAGANALGAAIGPIVCGALVSAASWRAAFGVVAALGVIFALVGWPVFPRIRPLPRRVDVPGQLLMVATLALVVIVAHDATRLAPWMLVAGVIAIAALIWIFVLVESRTEQPMLSIDQLRDRAFSGNAAVTVVGTMAFFGPLYLISIGLQDAHGMTAFLAGVALLPLAIGNILAALAAGKVQGRFGIRGTMILGSVLIVVSLTPLPFAFDQYVALIPILVLLGIGWGLVVPSTSAAGLVRAKPGNEGLASGVTSGGRELGAAIAAAVVIPLGLTIGAIVSVLAGLISLAIVFMAVRGLRTSAPATSAA